MSAYVNASLSLLGLCAVSFLWMRVGRKQTKTSPPSSFQSLPLIHPTLSPTLSLLHSSPAPASASGPASP
jgi:hypothetical protein